MGRALLIILWFFISCSLDLSADTTIHSPALGPKPKPPPGCEQGFSKIPQKPTPRKHDEVPEFAVIDASKILGEVGKKKEDKAGGVKPGTVVMGQPGDREEDPYEVAIAPPTRPDVERAFDKVAGFKGAKIEPLVDVGGTTADIYTLQKKEGKEAFILKVARGDKKHSLMQMRENFAEQAEFCRKMGDPAAEMVLLSIRGQGIPVLKTTFIPVRAGSKEPAPDLDKLASKWYFTDHPDHLPKIAKGILRELEKAHKEKIIIRDLKPGNIIISYDDKNEPVVHLIDFGISMKEGENIVKGYDPTYISGTAAFMSQEQGSRAPASQGMDDHAFRATWFHMLFPRELDENYKRYYRGDFTPTLKPPLSEHDVMGRYKNGEYDPGYAKETNNKTGFFRPKAVDTKGQPVKDQVKQMAYWIPMPDYSREAGKKVQPVSLRLRLIDELEKSPTDKTLIDFAQKNIIPDLDSKGRSEKALRPQLAELFLSNSYFIEKFPIETLSQQQLEGLIRTAYYLQKKSADVLNMPTYPGFFDPNPHWMYAELLDKITEFQNSKKIGVDLKKLAREADTELKKTREPLQR